MINHLISIIVPVYNVEKYLHRCVDSILSQTYTNIEIILVDDGSPDNCPAICDEYAAKDSRVKVIHKANGGVSSARNAGLQLFSGEYLTFVDSDDFVGEKYVENMLDNISDDIGIVISSFNYVSQDLKLIKKVSGTENDKTIFIDDSFDFSQKTINRGICCKLYRKEVIEGLVFSDELSYGEDALFNAKAFCNSNAVKYITDCSYHYVKYDESLSHGKLTLGKTTILSSWEKIIQVFPKDSLSYKKCAETYIITCFLVYGSAVALQGSDDEVVNYFYSLIKSEKTQSIYQIAPKTIKLRMKYNLLIHFRKIYDTLLLLKEPIVKHYR